LEHSSLTGRRGYALVFLSETQPGEDPSDAATNTNDMPGFGVVAVLCALLGGALLARQRR
jgi:PGF-CTERM protein